MIIHYELVVLVIAAATRVDAGSTNSAAQTSATTPPIAAVTAEIAAAEKLLKAVQQSGVAQTPPATTSPAPPPSTAAAHRPSSMWRASTIGTGQLPHALPHNASTLANPASSRVQWKHCEGNVCPLRYCNPHAWEERHVREFKASDHPSVKGVTPSRYCNALGGRLPTAAEVKTGMFVNAEDGRYYQQHVAKAKTNALPPSCHVWVAHSEVFVPGSRKVPVQQPEGASSSPCKGARSVFTARADGGELKGDDACATPGWATRHTLCVADIQSLCVCLTPCEHRKTKVFDPLKWCETYPSCPTATIADDEHPNTGRSHAELAGPASGVGPHGFDPTDGGGRTAWVHCEAPLFTFPFTLNKGQRQALRESAAASARRHVVFPSQARTVRAMVGAARARSTGAPRIMSRNGPARPARTTFATPRNETTGGLRHYIYLAPSPPDGLGSDFNWIKIALLMAIRHGAKLVLPHAQMLSENSPQYLAGEKVLTPLGTPPGDLFHPFGLGVFAPSLGAGAHGGLDASEMFRRIEVRELQVAYVGMAEEYASWDVRSGWWAYTEETDPTGERAVDEVQVAYDAFDANPFGRGREGVVVIKTMPTGYFHFPLEVAEWLRYAYVEVRSILRPSLPVALQKMPTAKRAIVLAVRLGDLLLPQYAGHTSRLMSMDFYIRVLTMLFARSSVAQKLGEQSGGAKLSDSASLGCETAHVVVIAQLPPLKGAELESARLKVHRYLSPIVNRFGSECVSIPVCTSVQECEAEQSTEGNLRALLRDMDTLTRADVFVGSRSSSMSRLAAAISPSATIKLLPFDGLETGPPTLEGIDHVLEVCENSGNDPFHTSFDLGEFDKLWVRRFDHYSEPTGSLRPPRKGRKRKWRYFPVQQDARLPRFSNCAAYCRTEHLEGAKDHVSVFCSQLKPNTMYDIYLIDEERKKVRRKELRAQIPTATGKEKMTLEELDRRLETMQRDTDAATAAFTQPMRDLDLATLKKIALTSAGAHRNSYNAHYLLDASIEGTALHLAATVPIRPDSSQSAVSRVGVPCGPRCKAEYLFPHWTCSPEEWEPTSFAVKAWPPLKHYNNAGWTCSGGLSQVVKDAAQNTDPLKDANGYTMLVIPRGRIPAKAYTEHWSELTVRAAYLNYGWRRKLVPSFVMPKSVKGERKQPPLHSVTVKNLGTPWLACRGAGLRGGDAAAGTLVCCSTQCGVCGGTGCETRRGRYQDHRGIALSPRAACCIPEIVEAKRTCDEWAPPCSLSWGYDAEYYGTTRKRTGQSVVST